MANLFNHEYPYLDEHELNLDWLIAKMKELIKDFDEFKVVNNITFSGTWNITKQYPAWTIVSDNNIGYVSLQPVPVGIPLTNGAYWVEVIDYTAQIAGLENRVIALETTVGDASSGLVHDVDVLEDDVAAMQYDDVLIVFDSYGTTYGNPVGDLTTIPGTMQTLTSRNIRHFEVSGGGFVRDTGNGTFYSNLVTWISGQSNLDHITEVIVAAGRNDWTATKADLKTAMIQFYDYCDLHLPNLKKKSFGYIANGDNTAVHGTKAEQLACYMNFKEICDETAINWMPNIDCVLHEYSLLLSDGVHPSNVGKVKLAEALIQAIEGTYNWSVGFSDVQLTAETGYSISQSANALTGSFNNITEYLSQQYIVVTLPAAISAALEQHEFASLNDNANMRYPLTTVRLPYNIVYTTSSNELMPIGGYVELTPDGTLKANIYAPAGIRANNVSQIILLGNGTNSYQGATV